MVTVDPNANVRERIALYLNRSRSTADTARLRELTGAYGDWRAAGGFSADAALQEELQRARAEDRVTR